MDSNKDTLDSVAKHDKWRNTHITLHRVMSSEPSNSFYRELHDEHHEAHAAMFGSVCGDGRNCAFKEPRTDLTKWREPINVDKWVQTEQAKGDLLIASELLTKPHVRPLGAQVIIIPTYQEQRDGARWSEGGVVLPDTADNEPVSGRIVALGDGYEDACPTCFPNGRKHEFEVKVGDEVLWLPWLASTVIIADTEFYIVAERDIVGIV